MSNLYLGLDASTQSLSAMIIDLDTRKVVYDVSLNYDETLPHYGTQNGVLDHSDPQNCSLATSHVGRSPRCAF